MLDKIFSGLGTVASSATKVVEVFRPNAEAADSRETDNILSARDQFGKEFRENKTWFDSIVDGLNRLPRPSITFLLIYYLSLSFLDKVTFAEINLGLSTIPEPMWWLIGACFAFYFPARSYEKKLFTQARERMVSHVAQAEIAKQKTERLKLKTAQVPTEIMEDGVS